MPIKWNKIWQLNRQKNVKIFKYNYVYYPNTIGLQRLYIYIYIYICCPNHLLGSIPEGGPYFYLSHTLQKLFQTYPNAYRTVRLLPTLRIYIGHFVPDIPDTSKTVPNISQCISDSSTFTGHFEFISDTLSPTFQTLLKLFQTYPNTFRTLRLYTSKLYRTLHH